MSVTIVRIMTAACVAVAIVASSGCGESQPPASPGTGTNAPPPTPTPAKQPRTSYPGQALDRAEQVRDLAGEHDKAIQDAIGE